MSARSAFLVTFVHGGPDDREAVQALAGFGRFPSWMWRSSDVLDFIGWLRDYNDNAGTPARQAGVYGLDLYSLHKSMDDAPATYPAGT